MAFARRAFPSLRVAGFVLGAGILAVAGLAYGFFISEQRRYIVGRDFRLLSNLAQQLDSTVDAEVRVIMNLAGEAGVKPDLSMEDLTGRWVKLRGGPYQASDIKFAKVPSTSVATGYKLNKQLAVSVPLRLRGSGTEVMVGTLQLQHGLESIVASGVGQGAFDAILLSPQDGTMLLGAGPAAQQFRSSGLGVLSSKPGADGKVQTFAELAKTITVTDVSLAGVDYSLFLFPCCLSSDNDSRLVLSGLVRAETLRSGSWAISTTLVKVAVLGLLVAMVSWPFLKLTLLGDRQQVRVSDFFQLGAASVAGLAIVTIVLLDVSAYLRLNGDMDEQLEDLANDLDLHATAEIRDAYVQLECLEEKMHSLDATTFDDGKMSSVLNDKRLICDPATTRWSDAVRRASGTDDRLDPNPPLAWAYPFFDAVAFVDKGGMQQIKLGTAKSVANRISVGDREYFSTLVRGRGWKNAGFCQNEMCALESVWSWTSGEPRAVLAKKSSLKWGPPENMTLLPVATISIPMRSLIGPVLPPGFAFAVIDHAGRVLFHSDRQRNGNEDFFVETDNNRRLRAQIAAHSAEHLNIKYWGSDHRAYLKPMALPDMYVVAMATKERAWAINREWLVVTLFFVAIYVALWLIVAVVTLWRNASWVWPDPARGGRYVGVSGLCGALLAVALTTAWVYDRSLLLLLGILLPVVGWIGTYLILKHRPRKGRSGKREPLIAYSVAAVLVLLVTGVVPGALLFLASYQLHVRSYIKNSQLIVARRLSDRNDRLSEEYLNKEDGKAARLKAATQVGRLHDLDLYVDFFYDTSIKAAPSTVFDSASKTHESVRASEPPAWYDTDKMVLPLLEDYFPYYSEASVEWRELLHDSAGDRSWESNQGRKSIGDFQIVFTSRTGSLPVELTSWVPRITHVPPTRLARGDYAGFDENLPRGAPPQPVATTGGGDNGGQDRDESATRNSATLLPLAGILLVALSWGVVQILNGRIYLVGITEPLWACDQLAVNAGENVLVLCDKTAKINQIAGLTPLKLEPIVHERDIAGAWRRALFALDERVEDGPVLIADFDDRLEDAVGMDRKLALLDELVSDQSRTVILLSQISLRGLTDSLRHSARVISAARQKRTQGQKAMSTEASESALERWRRVLTAFVVVERRELDATCPLETVRSSPAESEHASSSLLSEPKISSRTNSWSDRFDEWRTEPVVSFLTSEGRSHPYVRRVCEDLQRSNAVKNRRLTRRQAFDEVAERTAHFYRGLWASCSEDEKVVLGHIAQHGLANGSVRSVVRRLLGRRLLYKDPALRPMNETFRRFVLTRECSEQVAKLETENGPSAWDRLRLPLGVATFGVAVFLFATQKELYNAIFGATTAAAASVPALIRAVGTLVGRPVEGPGTKA